MISCSKYIAPWQYVCKKKKIPLPLPNFDNNKKTMYNWKKKKTKNCSLLCFKLLRMKMKSQKLFEKLSTKQQKSRKHNQKPFWQCHLNLGPSSVFLFGLSFFIMISLNFSKRANLPLTIKFVKLRIVFIHSGGIVNRKLL